MCIDKYLNNINKYLMTDNIKYYWTTTQREVMPIIIMEEFCILLL